MMNSYPPVVAKIANDYLERVQSLLRNVPALERDEFLKEIQSHTYEAYQQTPGDDGVARILAVLRNLGEPAEVVADRLPGAMLRSGAKRNLPLLILSGLLVAIFGIPLGFGGVGVLMGMLAALAGVLVAYYAVAGAFFFTGGVLAITGLVRMYWPALWDKLVAIGAISIEGPAADVLNQLTPTGQGLSLIVFGALFIAGGLGMVKLGKHLVRGLRFLCSLAFDRVRKLFHGARRRLHLDKGVLTHMGPASATPGA